ncbi:MAG: 50S ribosomal protein L13 [Chloroflexi bacterium]|nr:50S ribosomal protein L13 [Chloroflexota bacterium]
MNTYSVKAKDIKRSWHVIDADGQILGKVATEAATLLMGKNKTTFTNNLDTGDYVVIINAAKFIVTGKKMEEKVYYRHSNYPGGLKTTTLAQMLEKDPVFAVQNAVKGMLPSTKLGNAMFKKLKVYAGAEHPHTAQTNV